MRVDQGFCRKQDTSPVWAGAAVQADAVGDVLHDGDDEAGVDQLLAREDLAKDQRALGAADDAALAVVPLERAVSWVKAVGLEGVDGRAVFGVGGEGGLKEEALVGQEALGRDQGADEAQGERSLVDGEPDGLSLGLLAAAGDGDAGGEEGAEQEGEEGATTPAAARPWGVGIWGRLARPG